MGFRGRIVGLLCGALLCGRDWPAEAAPGDADAKRLSDLLRSGAEAASAKRWEACATALTEAAALDDAPKTWGDLGLCEEQASRFALAHTHLRRAMESAPPQVTKEPWTRYQTALARIKERVALLVVTTFPPSAKVVIDGRPVGVADGRAFAIEPGAHTIAARLEGYEDASDKLTARARDQPSMHLHLTEKPKTPVLPVVKARTEPPSKALYEPHPRSLARLFVPAPTARGFLVGLTYATASATLASGAVWIGLEVDRASLSGRLDRRACSPATSPQPVLCGTLQERFAQRNTAADFTLGLGIASGVVVAATAVAMGVEWSNVRTAMGPLVLPNGGGIAAFGVW